MRFLFVFFAFFLLSIPSFSVRITFETTILGKDRKILTTPEGESFRVFEVPEDGDCCFHALNTTRSKILNYLIDDLEDERIQFLLLPEMFSYYGEDIFTCNAEGIMNYLLKRYFIEGGQAVTQDKFVDCIEYSPESGEDVQTGMLDCISELLGININVWRRGDIKDQIILSREIVSADAIHSYNLLYELDTMHFKVLLTEDSNAEIRQNCFDLELDYFVHYCKSTLKCTEDQIQEILKSK